MERLKQHLVTVEETYTQEALANEDNWKSSASVPETYLSSEAEIVEVTRDEDVQY